MADQQTESVRLTAAERAAMRSAAALDATDPHGNDGVAMVKAVERIVADRLTAEREWFKTALTSDQGDLLDVEWLRENWWVKHVLAEHFAGPSEQSYPPAVPRHEHDGSGCIECVCNAAPWSADDCTCPGGFA